MDKRRNKGGETVMKNYLKHGIISIALVVLSLAGCKADHKELPSVPQARSDSSISAISSETSISEDSESSEALKIPPLPTQLQMDTALSGENFLKISASGETAEFEALQADFTLRELCNGIFIGHTPPSSGPWELFDFHGTFFKFLPGRGCYFLMDNLICAPNPEGSITLLDGMGNPLDVSFQFDFGADTKTSPEKFSGIPERTLSVSTLREYYPYGVSYDEEKEWIIMCYKRSEFMVDGRMESGIAVFDLEGNLLLDLPTPEEYKEYIGGTSGLYFQVSKGYLGDISWFEILPVEGEPLVIPVEYYTCLLVDLERQSWELVEREQVEAMLQGSGWRIEWKGILGTRLLPEQEPVELTIVPGEESTKLFFGDSEEPVFEIEGCYTADGYMIDKATGDIYTCLEQVSPGYGDIS